jgi:MoaA/NifB/PqqE/SkfB family radical SAM enzyme
VTDGLFVEYSIVGPGELDIIQLLLKYQSIIAGSPKQPAMEQFLQNIQKAAAKPDSHLVEIKVDEQGQIVLSPEIARELGLVPGARGFADVVDGTLRLRRPLTQLSKVYLEPTSACNLACRTCMRNTWNEEMGSLSMDSFARILEGLSAFDPVPMVFFGGFGEPLSHPKIGEMVAKVKSLGARAELITNATLLDDRRSRLLIDAGLDCLWVSLDGATPESYTDVRLAEAFPEILDNLTHFRSIIRSRQDCKTEVGVSFVAMKRNFKDLLELFLLRNRIGASRFLVTNVLPYTEEHCDEILYHHVINKNIEAPTMVNPEISLPRMDFTEITRDIFMDTLRIYNNVRLEGERIHQSANRCPFIDQGSVSIGWDGELSPCLGLMHSYRSYFQGQERFSRRYTLGNIRDRSLKELWEAPEYLEFRERVQKFPYPPCAKCGGCTISRKNERDCEGNPFPTCGGCLWAQGVIRCP